ncbi:MAG: S8 family serine peptidase [Frankiaceae bacterium]|nr:S8 family serine peptidase [Frankiaceae bacterium]
MAVASTSYSPAADVYSQASVTAQIGASRWWDAGFTGKGVDVAVIDSGVSPVEGLDQPGKVINGPDLSFESQAPNLTHLDGYGHGTFMAGLIAGHDANLTAPYSKAPADAYRGVAPDARIVNVKAGASDGAVDVTQVIAAIDWTVAHRHDNGMNIRVLSLSYGTNSTQSATTDPLSFAVEQAWRKGIVVVASAGNTGYQRGAGAPGLASPAYNPMILAAGGYDTHGTASFSDDTVGTYSASSAGCGSRCKNPDLVAMGSHLQGLRVPGGYLDTFHPEGILGDRYFRGSGTSQAAAITAGEVALVLQKYPALTPDQVKRFLTNNGQKVPGADSQAQGGGEIALATLATKTPAAYVQNVSPATGGGSLELSRGTDHLNSDGVTLTGAQDIFGLPVDTVALAKAEASGTAWTDGDWLGRNWAGRSWAGDTWSSVAWTGRSWAGRSWADSTWSSATWTGRSWAGRSWAGQNWSGSTWSGRSWADGSWS